MTDYHQRIRQRMGTTADQNPLASVVVERLKEWGAEPSRQFDSEDPWEGAVYGSGGRTNIDFFTPLPGDQPIASGITLSPGGIIEATIRYGVLDAPERKPAGYIHPTEDPEMIQRLRAIVVPEFRNSTGTVLVNYGDVGRRPRPHLLLGWKPSFVDISDEEIVADGNPDATFETNATINRIVRIGGAIREEFRGEFE